MAIHARNGCRDLLNAALACVGVPLLGLRMVEFGNQRLKFDPGEGARRLQSAKPFFQFFGILHTSIDINGREGALPIDLGKPIDWGQFRALAGFGMGAADIVTDFGTLEHVRRGQFQAFKTADDLCRPGGLMVHALPATGTCRRHGDWKYSVPWFADLARANAYDVVQLRAWDKSESWPGRIKPGDEIYVLAILRKRGDAGTFGRAWVAPPKS